MAEAGPTTVVIDYGAGNLHSIVRALAHVGCAVRVASTPEEAGAAELLVLPGQGRFGQVVRSFRASGFEPLVRAHIAAARPFLGICVGLQLLLDSSEEDPDEPGLGIVPGAVLRFSGAVAVPQMGWNRLAIGSRGRLLDGVEDGAHVYFANSFYAAPDAFAERRPSAYATTTYGATAFPSAFSFGALHATQFHPEKSQRVGLRVLGNVREAALAARVA